MKKKDWSFRMSNTFFVSLSPSQAANRIQEGIVRGSITGELIDSYSISTKEGYSVSVLLFEKHYYRAGNRLTLTVTIDDFTGKTRVHTASGGGGEGLFRFDWGASESFARSAKDILKAYIIYP
jgi:hypothetical protein